MENRNSNQVYLVVLVELAVRGVQEGQEVPYPLVPQHFPAVQEFLKVLKHLWDGSLTLYPYTTRKILNQLLKPPPATKQEA